MNPDLAITLLSLFAIAAAGLAAWQAWLRYRMLTRRTHAEVHLRALFEGSIQGIIIHRDGVPIAANERAAEIFGYDDADDIRNMKTLDRGISPADLKRMLAYQKARREGKPVPEIYQFQGIRKDGSAFWAFTRVSRIVWQGAPATLATVFDISDLRKVEEELRQHQQLLQTVFDTIPYALYVKGPDRRYMMANKAMAERWGVTAQELIGRLIARPDLRTPDESQAIADLDTRVFTTGQLVDEVIPRTYPGGVAHVRQIKAPLRDAEGKIVGIVGLGEEVTARVAAEQQLQSQQALMLRMINALPHAIYMKDAENRFLLVNDTHLRLHDLPREAVLGRRLEELSTARQWDLGRLEAMDREVLATRAPVESGDLDYTRPDGTEGVHRVTKIPLLDAAGELTGVVGVAEDITERLAAERALRESEQRFRDFTEGASDWFWEMDADLRYTAVVGPAYEARIQDSATILGKTAWDIEYPPEEQDSRVRLRAELEAHQPIRGRVLRVYGRGGGVRSIRYNGIPVHDAAGTFLGYRGTGADITDEVAAEQRAHVAHARLRDAVAALPAGFMLWDAQDRLVMWNDRLVEILPAAKDVLVAGITYAQFVARATEGIAEDQVEDRPDWIEARIQAFRNPGAIQEFKLKDGRWVRMLDRRTEQGTVSLRFDVSDTKQRELELRQAQKMEALGQLTGGVAHDFNNLMQVILGYVTLVMRSMDANDPKRELMGQIRNAGKRASELTQQLLAFSRKQVLRPAAVDLNAVVIAQGKMLSRLLGARIHLETQLDPRLSNILADRGMIEQAIMNLAINARDAMPSGGKIVLATEQWQADDATCRANPWARPGLYAALRCIDTGSGMSPEVRQRAFEPFFTTKAPGEGTGLGLSLVYGIAQQHGGTALIESQQGTGTTVIIHLPADPNAAPAPEPQPVADVPGRGQTILIAEDTDAVRDLIEHVLMEQGYRVLTAPDGDVAVSVFQQNADAVDLVILDVVMPHVGGLEAQERISALRPEVPILFSTGWYDQRDQKAIEHRGIPVIMKPYSADELLRVVRETLAQRGVAN